MTEPITPPTEPPEEPAQQCFMAVSCALNNLQNHFPGGPPVPGQVFGLLCIGTNTQDGVINAGFALVPLPFRVQRPGDLALAQPRIVVPGH